MALPARADSEELAKENAKSVVALKGEAVFSIAKVLLCFLQKHAVHHDHVLSDG